MNSCISQASGTHTLYRNWLNAKELSEKYSVSSAYVNDLFKTVYDRLNESTWRIKQKRGRRGLFGRYLHAEDAERFARHYKLDAVKTEQWYSAKDIARHFSRSTGCKIDTCVIYRIFNELVHTGGRDPFSENITWKISVRLHRRVNLACLHVDDLYQFGVYYGLNAPMQKEGWLSAKDVYAQSSETDYCHRVTCIFNDLQFTNTPDLMLDPDRKMVWEMRFFNIKGRPTPCLKADSSKAFLDCYRPNKAHTAPVVTPEWLSTQDIAEYLGTADIAAIQPLLDRLQTPDAHNNNMSGYLHDPIKQLFWRVDESSGVRRLHNSDIERLIRSNRLGKLRGKGPRYRITKQLWWVKT